MGLDLEDHARLKNRDVSQTGPPTTASAPHGKYTFVRLSPDPLRNKLWRWRPGI